VTAVAEAPEQVTEWQGDGLYPDLPADRYHADIVPGGSLSSSGARKLLAPSCPAKFRHALDHGEPPKKIWDLGTAAHKLVLDDGPELVLVDRSRWDTNEAKAEVANIRSAGNVPLKRHELDQVHAMADALRKHPEAGPLLNPDSGSAEQSLYWSEAALGITRRARIDWLRYDGEAVDYKTCKSADLDAISKAFFEHGYHAQADWYLAGLKALGYADGDTPFRFVFQEKTEPFVVTVVRPDPLAMRIGHDLNEAAMQLYVNCRESGHWPGHSEITEVISLPVWVERMYADGAS
jgi:PDDEXK-like domain of unknown function (DUF3799)